jgi:uncharacterized membrane protein YqaE (UPF0057 family)
VACAHDFSNSFIFVLKRNSNTMTKSIVTLLLSAVILVMGSCSIEKRVHQRGYHIAKKTSFHKNGSQSSDIVAFNKEAKNEVNNELAKNHIDFGEATFEENTKTTISEERGIQEEKQTLENKNSATSKSTLNSPIILKKRSIAKQSIRDLATEDTFSTEQKQKEHSNNLLDDTMKILILILCFLLPPVAVWLLTEDVVMLIISIVLSLLFWLPGIIFALYHFFQVY